MNDLRNTRNAPTDTKHNPTSNFRLCAKMKHHYKLTKPGIVAQGYNLNTSEAGAVILFHV